jgi:hypothetical protein
LTGKGAGGEKLAFYNLSVQRNKLLSALGNAGEIPIAPLPIDK